MKQQSQTISCLSEKRLLSFANKEVQMFVIMQTTLVQFHKASAHKVFGLELLDVIKMSFSNSNIVL